MIEINSLVVLRYSKNGDELLSRWYLNGEWVCYGVENAQYQIPIGFYMATKSWSPRFNGYYYELSNVPGRREILIHPANKPKELEGCLAPGLRLSGGELSVLDSRKALTALHQQTDGKALAVSVVEDFAVN